VFAAALVGQAGAIVTENLKHFPPDKVPSGIQVIPPNEFAANTVAVAPHRALEAVLSMRSRLKVPPMSVDELLSVLRTRYGMDEAVDLIHDVR
jgi:hypothetical protein